MSRRRNQRGAAAVEFGLCLPALILIIGGSLYLGRALQARGRLVEAVGYAARTAAIGASTTPNGDVAGGAITQAVNDKLASENACQQPVAINWQVVLSPYRHIDVHAECVLSAPLFGGTFGLTRVSADASMPIDVATTN